MEERHSAVFLKVSCFKLSFGSAGRGECIQLIKRQCCSKQLLDRFVANKNTIKGQINDTKVDKNDHYRHHCSNILLPYIIDISSPDLAFNENYVVLHILE